MQSNLLKLFRLHFWLYVIEDSVLKSRVSYGIIVHEFMIAEYIPSYVYKNFLSFWNLEKIHDRILWTKKNHTNSSRFMARRCFSLLQDPLMTVI